MPAAAAGGQTIKQRGTEMSEAMSEERLARVEWLLEAGSTGAENEVLAEVKRARGREAALVDEVDEQAEQLRRISAELSRCTDLNRDLVATNTNLAETVKEAREQIRDRDYVNANLRKTVEEYRAQLGADVRSMRAVVDAAGAVPIPQFESMPELAKALNALLEQFEDRIKVVDEAESLARVRAFRATLGVRGENDETGA